jgi:hypothetical protein
MPNYLTRKKPLMGNRYEVEVPLSQYGGAIVRIHAVPDMELARIEDRIGYKLEDTLSALSSQQDLTDEEIEALKSNTASVDLIAKSAKALIPKLTLFLGEIVKAAKVPDPDYNCKGKGCDDCKQLRDRRLLRSSGLDPEPAVH